MDNNYSGSNANSNRLFVGNLLYEVTDEDLRDLFSQVGEVDSASVVRFHDGRSKGFGFVQMKNPEDIEKAIEMFNEQDFKGRKVFVSRANPPKPRTHDRSRDRSYDR